jgi:hypothetical protein
MAIALSASQILMPMLWQCTFLQTIDSFDMTEDLQRTTLLPILPSTTAKAIQRGIVPIQEHPVRCTHLYYRVHIAVCDGLVSVLCWLQSGRERRVQHPIFFTRTTKTNPDQYLKEILVDKDLI